MATETESDKQLVPVTCVVHAESKEPLAKWSFEVNLDKGEKLRDFIKRINSSCGIKERCDELKVDHYKTAVYNKSFVTSPDFPKGRSFAIDKEDQWAATLPLILRAERELIGKRHMKLGIKTFSM